MQNNMIFRLKNPLLFLTKKKIKKSGVNRGDENKLLKIILHPLSKSYQKQTEKLT